MHVMQDGFHIKIFVNINEETLREIAELYFWLRKITNNVALEDKTKYFIYFTGRCTYTKLETLNYNY